MRGFDLYVLVLLPSPRKPFLRVFSKHNVKLTFLLTTTGRRLPQKD